MCYNPKQVYDKSSGAWLTVSCRKCTECMQVRANEWALRGHFELQDHEQNCFLTLTYENNPVRLHKEHMQKFIKRLRKKIEPIKIRYFSCGEYGDRGLRPHYHIIIFGYDFADKQYVRKSASDIPIYESKELNELWPHGMAITQEANVNTIRYSAKYSTKLKENLPNHLKKYPEFNTMSNDLGIKQALKKMDTYMMTDEIYIDGFSYKIPDILLRKYAKDILQYDDENAKLFTKAYKNNREQKRTVIEELKTRERLAQKKILHSQLRQL